MIVPFEPGHLADLLLQPGQQILAPTLADPSYGRGLAASGRAWSGVTPEGHLFACAGFLEQWPGRAIAWALVAEDAGRHFVELHRAVAKALRECPFSRVETTVQSDFLPGHRWAQMLGFGWEGTLRKFSPDGRDHDLYARIR